jgi:Ca2+-binding RTX toxin-like protein
LTFTDAVGTTNDLANVTNVEKITLTAGAAASETTVNTLVAAGATLTVDGSALAAALTWTGTAELDGFFSITGGSAAAGDTITGGGLADTISGGAGADVLVGGAGADSITGGLGADVINVGVGSTDVIRLAGTDTGSFTAPVTNTISTTTFDVITGLAAGDQLVFTDYGAVSSDTAADDLLDSNAEATANTLSGAALAANAITAIRGDYTAATATFVGSVAGVDTFLVYDSNDLVATTAAVAVVLVGTGTLTFGYTAGDAAGLMTLA